MICNPETLVAQLTHTRKFDYCRTKRTFGKRKFINVHLIRVNITFRNCSSITVRNVVRLSINFLYYFFFVYLAVFDEDFVFEERPSMIGRRTIEILLYDFDSYSRHFCIGGTQIELGKLDLTHKIDVWNFLGSCSEQDAKIDLGDLMVSMSYLPSAERLTVVLIKARNLKVVDVSRNSSDPYVKVSLIQNGKKIKKRKSGVYRNTICPVFNEALTFDISKDTLKTCTIEFLVLHDSLLGKCKCHCLLLENF